MMTSVMATGRASDLIETGEDETVADTPPSTMTADGIKVGTDAIGVALKSYFDELAAEPVPDRFLDLLSKLERS